MEVWLGKGVFVGIKGYVIERVGWGCCKYVGIYIGDVYIKV